MGVWGGGAEDEEDENRETLPLVGSRGFRTLYLLPFLWEDVFPPRMYHSTSHEPQDTDLQHLA